jgi:Glyoxalase-like domain
MAAESAGVSSQVDHLVVAASTLDQAVAWCEHRLGVVPALGGEHPLMGTHNRLISLASPTFPDVYLELIAINSGAACARPAGMKRWFDLDDGVLQQQLAQNGPRLIHFVARTAQAEAAVRALHAIGLDRGEVIQASRPTPQGALRWKITVRDDGQRLFDGALPTLIEWGDLHPASRIPASGVTLTSLQLSHPRADALRLGFEAIGLTGVGMSAGSPNLAATLQTPRGGVVLESSGI